jgi:hypothetical protein
MSDPQLIGACGACAIIPRTLFGLIHGKYAQHDEIRRYDRRLNMTTSEFEILRAGLLALRADVEMVDYH